jgi:hypothetical protein
MNWKGCGRKRSWPNLRYYPGICLEGLRENTENLSDNRRSLGPEMNSGSPKYEAEVITIRPRRSVHPQGILKFIPGNKLIIIMHVN